MDCDTSLEDYINSDNHVLATEEFTDDAIINEVRKLLDGNVKVALSHKNGDTSPPVSHTTTQTLLWILPIGYVTHLDMLERELLMRTNNQKQAKISYFQ